MLPTYDCIVICVAAVLLACVAIYLEAPVMFAVASIAFVGALNEYYETLLHNEQFYGDD